MHRDIGFITRTYDYGKKQWLKTLQTIPGKGGPIGHHLIWDDKPHVSSLYSKSVYDELAATRPGLSFRPCDVFTVRRISYASEDDLRATLIEA